MSTNPDRQSATRISREQFLSDPGREQFLSDPDRERFLSDSGAEDLRPAVGPRPDIVTSWRRSQLVGVSPDGVDLPYSPPPQMPRRLLAAAGPVIDALEQDLRDTSGTVLLADREVRILDRRAGSRSWLRSLDRSNIAPGFLFAEEYAGTNGLGCAMEESRLFEVRGAEHFRERFQSLVCIAAPIRHPARNAVVGALNLTCSVDEFSPLARTVLRRAVSDVERRLLEASSPQEQQLLAQYTARSRRVGRPLIAVSADMLICNPAASAALERTDRELLWHWAAAVLGAAESATEQLVLGSGRPVVAHASRVAAGHRLVGAIIELYADERSAGHSPAAVAEGPSGRPDGPELGPGRPDAGSGRPEAGLERPGTGSGRPEAGPGRPDGGPGASHGASGRPDGRWPGAAGGRDEHGGDIGVTGRSAAAARLREAVLRAGTLGRPVLVTGEEGTGRRRLARTLLAQRSPQRPVVIDGASPGWLRRLDAAVEAASGPVLLVDLSTGDPAVLRSLVARAQRLEVPLAATAVEPGHHAGVFPFGIAVPPLRERRADVRDLTADLIAKLAPGRSLAVHPRTLLTLEAHAWPGNVRELQYVLSLAIQNCIGEELLERHLPLRSATRDDGLTPIERAQRDTIVTALGEFEGNKVAAAAALGFARSTLYRKMRVLRIDGRAPF